MDSRVTLPSDFGTRVKELREHRGMSTRALAEALDGVISQSGIVRMEGGKKIPSTSELLALSWVFGVSLEELTDEVPLPSRVAWAARSTQRVDTSEAVEQLTALLQLRNTLQKI